MHIICDKQVSFEKVYVLEILVDDDRLLCTHKKKNYFAANFMLQTIILFLISHTYFISGNVELYRYRHWKANLEKSFITAEVS